jgi:hypothetical protein
MARRQGLPLPVPVTMEFDSEATREREWQELVVGHLGLEDWQRVKLSDELDFIGDIAAARLRRHGLMHPPNSHLLVPLLQLARGGSVVTGAAGDVVFGGWQWHPLAGALARRRPPVLRDFRRVAHFVSPLTLRLQIARRRYGNLLPWLKDSLRERATTYLVRELAGMPRTWGSRMRWIAGARVWRATVRSARALAKDEGAGVFMPFLDDRFLESMALAGGRWGWGDRTATMRALFGDLLPDEVLARRTKAEFSGPFFASESRAFARRWDGVTGIDERHIDGEVLRRAWLLERPPYLSSTLLQATWLAAEGGPSPVQPSPDVAP